MFLARKVVLVTIFICSTLWVSGQVRHQIGLNTTQFFKQFIAQNNSTLVENNPYLITYRYHAKPLNIRAGIGGEYSFTNEDNSVNQFLQNTNVSGLALRIGADITKQIHKKWFIYYGLDLFTNRKSTIIETIPNGGQFVQKTTITQTSSVNGLAAVLTLEFRLNDKITLFTEANVNWNRGRTSDKVENPDFPDSSTQIKKRTGSTSYLTPLSLFFSILI